MHILGFTALMSSDGTSVFDNGISYSRYGVSMMLDNGIRVIKNNPDPGYFWELNILNNLLHLSCQDAIMDVTGPDMVWSSSSSDLYPALSIKIVFILSLFR